MSDEALIAGVSLGLDPSGFLGGSAEAQDEIEKLVASFIHASREGDKTVQSLAKSLSASPKEVAQALREMDKQDAQANRAAQRRQALAQKQAQERHRNEMRMLKERGQAVSNLRDSLLSLAAISIGGGAGLSGIYNAVKSTSQDGANEVSFARKTGTNARHNIAEETGADLSGMSNAGEARQSIATWSKAREQIRNDGELSPLYKELLRGVDLNKFTSIKDHDKALQYAISSMRHFGLTDADVAYRLEKSGLTSGGYTSFALDTKNFNQSNKEGEEYAKNIDPQKELKEAQAVARMEKNAEAFQRIVVDDMEPAIEKLGDFFAKLDAIADKNPDLVKDAAALAAGLTAIGSVMALLAPIAAVVKSIKMAAAIKSLQTELAALKAAGAATEAAAGETAAATGAAAEGAGLAAVSAAAAVVGGSLAGAVAAGQNQGYGTGYREVNDALGVGPKDNPLKGTTEKESHISDKDAREHYLKRTGDISWLTSLSTEESDRERTLMMQERHAEETNTPHSPPSSTEKQTLDTPPPQPAPLPPVAPVPEDRPPQEPPSSTEKQTPDTPPPQPAPLPPVAPVPEDRPPQEPPSSVNRGIRNNNPGNLRFVGQYGAHREEHSNSTFAAFDSPEAGLAALRDQLSLYNKRDHLDTVADIISKYAPPSDNNHTSDYIHTVAHRLGVGEKQHLGTLTPQVVSALMHGIIRVENSNNDPYGDKVERVAGLVGGASQARQSDQRAYLEQLQRQKNGQDKANLRTNHLGHPPIVGASLATSRPPVVHHDDRTNVAMTIQNMHVKANNPQQFQQQMQRYASHSVKNPSSWNSNQL